MNAKSARAATAAVVLLTLATVLVLPASGAAHDWPQWSGPHGNLTAVGNDAFPEQGFALEIAWSEALGSGYSGIAVAGDRLVTAFSDGESDLLVALDAGTGKELWRYRIAETMKGHGGSDDGPLGSPTLADGMVYGLGPWGQLFAVRLADGSEVWSRQIVDELGARAPRYGFGSSPAVVGDVLVVATGGDGGRSISGFDRRKGELVWSTGDDMVGYQSPTVLTVGGRQQVVAVTDRRLLGLVPETGQVLWQHEHAFRGEGFAHPVLVGENRILLTHWPEAALFQVTSRDGDDAVEELWRSDALRDLNFPVPWGGHLYGYRGRFLTCVDASTGKTVWKSRPPGPGNLMLVDAHLLIQARNGDLVIAAATPEGYRERARLKTLDSGYFNPLGFAAGRIFTRNRTQITSARIVEGPPAAVAAAPPGVEGMIAELVRKAAATADKKAVIDDFLSAHQQFPIIEGDDLVHFVYRGEVADLALAGNMFAGEEPMHRIPGTDFYYRSLKLEPRAHFLYRFKIFEESLPDPLNPRRFGSEGREQSELAMPGWELPRHLAQPPAHRGRIEKLSWKSEILDNERQVRVYLPPGYDASQERYPLLLVAAGDGRGEHDPDSLALGKIDHSLDNLIGESVAPLVVAFVTLMWPEHNPGSPQFAQALAEELIPQIDETYRTVVRPQARGIMGVEDCSFAALYAVFDQPDLFGKAALASFFQRDLREQLTARIAQGEKLEVDFYIEWSRHDWTDPVRGRDARADSRQLAEMLGKRGYRLHTIEVGDGFGWASWRTRTDRILETLFPLK